MHSCFKQLGKQVMLVLALFIHSHWVFASDHIDGVPSLALHEQLDLTDLYVFPTAHKPNHLSIIVNLYPGAAADAVFSEHVSYQVIVRKADIGKNPSTKQIITSDNEQAIIRCGVAEHSNHDDLQALSCQITRKQGETSQTVATATTLVGKMSGDDQQTSPLRIFAGSRSDPFFISGSHFKSVINREGFPTIKPSSAGNLTDRINVLAIVLELNMATLFPNTAQEMYAVAAESLATTEDGSEQVFDRVGRPEITNLSLHRFSGEDEAIKESYNQRHTFAVLPSKQAALFTERLKSNIAAYDQLDDVSNWSDTNLESLIALLMQDVQLIDLSKDCSAQNEAYFAIERALLSHESHKACGGRRLTDDVMRTIYALYIGGLAAKPVSFETGVSKPYHSSDKVLLTQFPYLAEPEPTDWYSINIRRFLINHIIKRRQD